MLALGLEILATTGGGAIVVVLVGGVMTVVVVDDVFVGVVGLVGVVVVVVGMEIPDGCRDLRAAAEMLVDSLADAGD